MVYFSGWEEFLEDADDFADAFDEIADDVDKRIDSSVRDVALSVESDAKSMAPEESGELRADIQTTKLADSLYSVGTTKEYAPSMEYGSQPHPITPNGPYPLSFWWERRGVWFTGYKVNHPGTPSHPFLRPSLAPHRDDLIYRIRTAIQNLYAQEFDNIN